MILGLLISFFVLVFFNFLLFYNELVRRTIFTPTMPTMIEPYPLFEYATIFLTYLIALEILGIFIIFLVSMIIYYLSKKDIIHYDFENYSIGKAIFGAVLGSAFSAFTAFMLTYSPYSYVFLFGAISFIIYFLSYRWITFKSSKWALTFSLIITISVTVLMYFICWVPYGR